MTFVTALALAIALLVAIPYAAHRLRRQRAEERPFAPARLVPAAPPQARRRASLEDRALLSVRALAVIALALLGASPFVRCSRLSLRRAQGASMAVAVVVDDSMSMRAVAGGGTRFERAKGAARELVASAQEGDSVALVLAGAPARVALAATTDLDAARGAVESLEPSDRATDLDGALALARSLVEKLPQVDRKVVVLSDLADGRDGAPPLGEGIDLPLWIPLEELRGAAPDCAVVSADREGAHVRARVACGPGASASGRALALVAPKGEIARAPAPAGTDVEASLALPADAPDDLTVRLLGGDAISSDDAARVLVASGPGAIGVVADAEGETAATGGAPVLEQALAALRLDVAVRPLPAAPDHAQDLAGFLALAVDDPPGFTPEQRRALAGFLSAGGSVLALLGPRAAAAPLGATLEPLLPHATTWVESSARGADPAKAAALLADGARSLVDLGAARRTALAQGDAAPLDVLVPWTDGAPLLARRAIGRGSAWIVTLPMSLDASDLALRPGVLALLRAFLEGARAQASVRRSDVGVPWTFDPGARVSAVGPAGAVAASREESGVRVTPPLVGPYAIEVDGREELRVAQPAVRELDLRPRAAAKAATGGAVGGSRASVDASPVVAVLLLALVAVELGLRLRARRAAAA